MFRHQRTTYPGAHFATRGRTRGQSDEELSRQVRGRSTRNIPNCADSGNINKRVCFDAPNDYIVGLVYITAY